MAASNSPATTFKPGHTKGFPKGYKPPPPRIYSKEECRQHREFAEAVLATAQGSEEHAIRQLRRDPRFKCGPQHAKRVVREVLDRWAQQRQGDKGVEDARSQAIARVRGMLALARGKPRVKRDEATGEVTQDGWELKPDHHAVAKYEVILMRLEGTDAPLRVDVNVRMSQALEGVISNLTAAQVERFVARRRELERLAGLARLRLPECIDVEGSEVAEEG